MNPLIDPWLRLIHLTGSEMGVTLLVSGRRITGMLTPIQRYEKWEREVVTRAARGGGKFTLPSLELPSLSNEQIAEIKAEWPALEKRLYDDSSERRGFGYFCVRNAKIHEAIPATTRTYPLLLVHTDYVAACMPGFHDPE